MLTIYCVACNFKCSLLWVHESNSTVSCLFCCGLEERGGLSVFKGSSALQESTVHVINGRSSNGWWWVAMTVSIWYKIEFLVEFLYVLHWCHIFIGHKRSFFVVASVPWANSIAAWSNSWCISSFSSCMGYNNWSMCLSESYNCFLSFIASCKISSIHISSLLFLVSMELAADCRKEWLWYQMVRTLFRLTRVNV